MKVCAITTWPPHPDGVALYSLELYTHLAELVDLKVVANLPERSVCECPKLKERTGLRCWRRGSFTYPLTIFRSTLKEGPDIVHIQHGWLLYGDFLSSTLFPILILLFRLGHKPCVVTMHMVIRRDAHIHDNPLVNLLAQMAILFISSLIVRISDRTIVHNYLVKQVLQREYALQKEDRKIIVIPHGVKSASEKPEMAGKSDGIWILSLGFVRERKGLDHLIKAFEKFLEVSPDSRLVIAGGRHAHDRSDHIVECSRLLTSNLSKHVLFTDFIDEKSLDRLIWKSDMIVLSSLDRYYIEASGALARVADYGKPVICSRVPKFEAELSDREDCIMTTPGDSAALAQALVSLMQNMHLRENIGQNLKRKFGDRRWKAVAEQHFDLYRSIKEI